MMIRSCDKCGATIGQKYALQVGVGLFYQIELCKVCAEPLIVFLNSNDILQDKLREYGFVEGHTAIPTSAPKNPVSD